MYKVPRVRIAMTTEDEIIMDCMPYVVRLKLQKYKITGGYS